MSPGDIVPRREQDKVFKELRDTRIATLLAENAALRARLAQAEAESTRMQHERDNERTKASEYRANAQVLRDKLNGDFWVWQHDGEDYPESLTCPILIHADHVREILGARAQAQARVVEMEGALRIIENHPRAKMACGYDIRADYDNGLIQGHRECAQIARRALSSSGLEVAEAVREAIVVLETNEILEIDETGRVTAVGSRKDAAKVAAKLRALGLGEVVEVMARAMFKTQPRVDKKKDYWAEYPDDDEEKLVYRNDARVALSALREAGWAVVPREATEEMMWSKGAFNVWHECECPDCHTRVSQGTSARARGDLWSAMLADGEVK